MSIRLTSQVWDSGRYEQTALLVLLTLADQANDEGVCWPAVSTIAARARCSARYVRTLLGQFEKDGWLSIEHREGKPSMYRLTIPTPEPQITPEPQMRTPLNPSSATPEPQITQTIKNHQRTTNIGREDVAGDFEAWYAAYPKKVARALALKAYRAARKKADAQTLLAGVDGSRLMARGRQYCPNPASWLNQERWLDEHDQPEHEESNVYRLPDGGQIERFW